MAQPITPSRLFSFPLNVLGAVLCASFSYYLVEGPIRAWGKRFRPAKAKQPIGIGAAA